MQQLSSSTTQPPAWAFLHSESPEQPFPGAAMTARLLRLFRDCPLQYHRFATGQLQEKDTDAFRFGRAVHTLVLDGSAAFNKKFAIGGPINPKTGKPFAAGTKAFEEWLTTERISRDKALTDTEADAMITVANAIRSHAEASRCLSNGWPSLVAEADVEQVRCRIHLDWLKQDEHGWLMIDVKTTDDLSRFETDAERYGYLHQFAFQHDVLQALGCDARRHRRREKRSLARRRLAYACLSS